MPPTTDPAAVLAAVQSVAQGAVTQTQPVAEVAPVAVAQPVIQPQVLAPPPTLPVDERINIPKALYDQFVANELALNRVRVEKEAEVSRATTAAALAAAKAGDAERAVELLRTQAAQELEVERTQKRQIEDRAKRYALDGAIATELSKHTLSEGSAEQLATLLQGKFVVEPKGESFDVRTPDFQPVGTYIGALLGRPEYQKYLAAKNPAGGVGLNPGAAQTTPTPTQTTTEAAPQPNNLGEFFVQRALAQSVTNPVDPRLLGGSAVIQGANGPQRVSLGSPAFGLTLPATR